MQDCEGRAEISPSGPPFASRLTMFWAKARGSAPGQSSEGARSDSIGGLDSRAARWIPEGILQGAAATVSFVWSLHSIALGAEPPGLPVHQPACADCSDSNNLSSISATCPIATPPFGG